MEWLTGKLDFFHVPDQSVRSIGWMRIRSILACRLKRINE
jgi:hypothetical protein